MNAAEQAKAATFKNIGTTCLANVKKLIEEAVGNGRFAIELNLEDSAVVYLQHNGYKVTLLYKFYQDYIYEVRWS